MTGHVRRVRGRVSRAFHVILGPWPLFAGPVFWVLFFWWLMQGMTVALFVPEPLCRFSCWTLPEAIYPGVARQLEDISTGQIDIVLIVASSLVPAGMIFGIFVLARRILKLDVTTPPPWGAYVLILVISSAVGAVVRFYPFNPILPNPLETSMGVANVVRVYIAITIVQVASGLLTRRYRRVARLAEQHAARASEQQVLVVEAEERARREVAEFLHDRVQADLLVSAIDIRRIAERVDAAQAQELNDVIEALERIRSRDVRGAGRRLSPDLAALGLDTALIELASSWSSAMRVDIHIDAATREILTAPEMSIDVLRAVYRVTEQALLNSAAHGRASCVEVRVKATPTQLMFEITDDGIGIAGRRDPAAQALSDSEHGPSRWDGHPWPELNQGSWRTEELPRGTGSAIIDAWMSLVHGTWQLMPAGLGKGGTTLRAILPLS